MSDEFKLQWSVSLPPVAQYAKGHMFNFRANTEEELKELFDAVLAGETIQKALDVAQLLTGAQTVTEGLKGSPEQSTQAASDASVTQLRTCSHGKRTRREGNGSRGPWVGYFCPRPKGAADQCEPVWED